MITTLLAQLTEDVDSLTATLSHGTCGRQRGFLSLLRSGPDCSQSYYNKRGRGRMATGQLNKAQDALPVEQ